MWADGTAAINGDGGAAAFQVDNLLVVVYQKSLEQERRTEPGTIQFGDEHAELNLRAGDDFLHVRRSIVAASQWLGAEGEANVMVAMC